MQAQWPGRCGPALLKRPRALLSSNQRFVQVAFVQFSDYVKHYALGCALADFIIQSLFVSVL